MSVKQAGQCDCGLGNMAVVCLQGTQQACSSCNGQAVGIDATPARQGITTASKALGRATHPSLTLFPLCVCPAAAVTCAGMCCPEFAKELLQAVPLDKFGVSHDEYLEK